LNKNGSDQNFPELTGIRAVAAYMVFFHHYTATCVTDNMALSFVKEFYVGVTIFFILSGFLIFYRYSTVIVLNKDFLAIYFRNRFARIYPSYFAIVVFTSIFYFALGNSTVASEIAQLFWQLTFIRGFSDTLKFIGVGQGWTLTVEETFYFLFPFIIVFIKRFGFFAVLLGVYAVGMILLGVGMWANFLGFFSPPEFVFNYTFFGRATEFFVGMYLAKLVLKRSFEKSPGRIPYKTIIGFAGVVLCIFAMSQFQFQECSYGTFSAGGIIINNLIMPVFIAMLFYGLISEGSFLKNFLASRVMVYLGKTSYVFYLIHVGIFQYLIHALISPNAFINFIIMIFLSILIYRTVEEPLNKLIRQVVTFQPEQLHAVSNVVYANTENLTSKTPEIT
jgi:peptidoglycan/LPS O-acetylase OafA/YrhL